MKKTKEVNIIMSHHSHRRHNNEECDKPRKFHDTVGKGKLDSTPIIVPTDFTEIGTSLNPDTSIEGNTHPGPFVAQAFHPSSQKFFGLLPRRNTPNDSPERAGKILMDDKKRGEDRFYKPRIRNINRNFAKKKLLESK